MIETVLKRAPTHHIVYFLLTSYIEARACEDTRGTIPHAVKRLPIVGVADIQSRLQLLRHLPVGRIAAHPLLSEVLHVFKGSSCKTEGIITHRACGREHAQTRVPLTRPYPLPPYWW
jgi:hypothetical protein